MLSGSKRPATETQTPKIVETFFVERLCAHSSDVRTGQTEPTGQTEWEIRATLSARQFKQIRCALLEMPNYTHTDDDVWYFEGGVRAIKRESNVHVQRKLERTRVNVPGSFTAPLFTKLVQSTEDDFSASESESYVRSLKRQAGCSGQDIPDIKTKWKVCVLHQLKNLPPLFSRTEDFIQANLTSFWYTVSGSLWFSRATKVDGVHVPEACFSLETTEEAAPVPPVPVFRRVRQRDSVELNKHVRLDLTHSVEYSTSCKTKHSWNVEIELLRPDATLPETVQDSGRALAEALEWVVGVVKCPK